jgi:hypothetical protein
MAVIADSLVSLGLQSLLSAVLILPALALLLENSSEN